MGVGKSTFAQELQQLGFYYSKFARNRSLYHLRTPSGVPGTPNQKVTASLPVAHELDLQRYPALHGMCLDN